MDGEADYQAFVWRHLRRNYLAHYLHGMLGMTGYRMLMAPTFLPAYLFSLSGSTAIVGLGLSLQQSGQILSPVIGANLVEHRPRVLPAAMIMGTLMRTPILLIAAASWFLHGPTRLVVTLGLLFALGLFSGAQRVVFQLLLAKVIPIVRRGRLQAYRNVTGGLIAAGLSYVAGRYLIGRNVFGNGYATTLLIIFVLTSLGLSALRMLMIEPEPPTLPTRTRLRDRLRDFRRLIASDRDYRNFLIAQALAVGGRMASPLYILHAGAVVHMTGAALGLFSVAYLGADTASNLIWGYLGDRFGFRSNLLASVGLNIAAIVTMIFAHSMTPLLFGFIGLGAGGAGYMMASQTLILEFGHRHDVAMRFAISATVEGAVAAFGPALAGVLATFGYPPVFALAGLLQFAALTMTVFGVREPRGRHVQPAMPERPSP